MLPVVRVEGPPGSQGRAHGEALRSRIADNVALYFDRFEREARLPRGEVLDRAAAYWAAVQAQSPDYAAGVRGVAEGSGIDLLEIVALNVRYEILYHQFTANALAGGLGPDGCTSFAVLPEASADGHLLLGQNWDWIPGIRGALVHATDPDGLETLAFTEAGIFGGKIGLSSRGVGLAVNGLTSTDDDWARMARPFHMRCRDILRAPDLASAVAVVADGPRSCSTNFVIGVAGGGAVDLEAAPGVVCRLEPLRGLLAHANHFVDPGGLGIAEPPAERRAYSVHRMERMRRMSEERAPVAPADLREMLADHDGHPNSVCRHRDPDYGPDEQYETVTSVVMDLDDRVMWATDGTPCEAGYLEVTL